MTNSSSEVHPTMTKLQRDISLMFGTSILCFALVQPNVSFAQKKANSTSTAQDAIQSSMQSPSGNSSALKNASSGPRFVDNRNPQAFDLIKLFQEAAQYDPTYNAAKAAYIAGKEYYWQAFSLLMPQLTGTMNTGSNDLRYDPNLGKKDYTISNTGWGLNLTQPLFNWAAYEKFNQGDFLTGVAEATFAQAQQDLIVRVSQAYFDALTSQDNLDLYRNKKGLIKEQLEQAKRNFEVGTATIVDTNAAQSRYDLVIAQEIAAEADLIVKKDGLEQIVGRSVDAILPLTKQANISTVVDNRTIKYLKKDKGQIATTDIVEALHLPSGQSMDEWAKQTEEVNYNVLIAKLNADIAKSNYNSARASRLPTVNLTASTGYSTSLSGTTVSYNPLPNTYYANQLGIQVSVPLFTGGYISSTVRQTVAQWDQAKANYELAKRTNATSSKQAYLGFNSGLSQVKAYEAAEKSALVSLQSSKVGYEVGVSINLDVLNAQDQLITTQATLYQSRYAAIMNGLKLKSLAAVLTDDDLKSVNALLH